MRKKILIVNSDPRGMKKINDMNILRRFIIQPRRSRNYWLKKNQAQNGEGADSKFKNKGVSIIE